PAVLAPLVAPARAQAAAAPALAGALDPLLRAPGLGSARTASVVDVATGRPLYGHGAATPMAPASTVKIATAAAALSALGPDHRLATTVVATPDGRTLTLVGGGDPTLDPARLKALAADTAKALRARGAAPTALRYDTSLYKGPVRHRIGVNDNIAPVTSLMTAAGRLDGSTRGPAPRALDPAAETARTFARLLAGQGVKLAAAPAPGRAPKGGPHLATTRSAPLSSLVERTLRDGSGLDRRARVSARLLTALLARAADPAHPELRPVLTGLPVGGFSGTLEDRYADGSPAAGLVRAKTGTLTGVNALAGTAVTRDGRLLAFAFLASGTPSPYEAQPALDALATALTAK
ncbi:D-alanyl-D-alanine carboxypeptidase, partial [Streptomyces sp. NPDC052644]